MSVSIRRSATSLPGIHWILLAEALLLLVGCVLDQPFLGVLLGGSILYLLLALDHPDLAWGLVWLAVPFSVERLLPGGHALHVPTEPMIVIVLLAWGTLLLSGKTSRLPLVRSRLHLPLAALGAAALLSAVLGAHPSVGVKAWAITLAYVAFGYLYCLATWNGPARIERALPWIVGFGALWGAYGAARVIDSGVSLRAAYGAARPFFTEHGAYAAYLAMILPVSLLCTLEARGRRRLLYGAASAAMALGVVLSLTRAAWIALVVVLPAMLAAWGWWRRRIRPVAAVLGSVLALMVFLAAIEARQPLQRHATSIAAAGDPSNLERINRWMAAVAMAERHPWLGVGLGAYPYEYPPYRRKAIVTELAYQHMGPHSELFRLLAEMGIVGLAAAVWLVVAAGRAGVRAFRRATDPGVKLIALGVMASLGTFLVHGLFRTYFDLEKVAVPFWAGLGILAALDRAARRDG